MSKTDADLIAEQYAAIQAGEQPQAAVVALAQVINAVEAPCTDNAEVQATLRQIIDQAQELSEWYTQSSDEQPAIQAAIAVCGEKLDNICKTIKYGEDYT